MLSAICFNLDQSSGNGQTISHYNSLNLYQTKELDWSKFKVFHHKEMNMTQKLKFVMQYIKFRKKVFNAISTKTV